MKFLLVDDHALYRQGLLLLLTRIPGEHVFLEAENCDAAVRLLYEHADIDVILLDLALPGMSGLDGLHRLRTLCPDTPIALVSANENAQLIRQSLQHGAHGFIPKSLNPNAMLAAVQVILSGGTFAPAQSVFVHETTSASPASLTARQLEVLQLLVKQLSNKEIATALGMRVNTVRVHVAAILKALSVENRSEAALAAMTLGLVPNVEQ